MSSIPEAGPDTIATVLGRVPSGLFVLVAGEGAGKQTGLLASWIQQASFDPPQVTVAVNKSRYLNDWLTPDAPVSINQVPRNDPGLLKHFGKGFEPDADAFVRIGTTTGFNGLPVLTDGMATLEGNVANRMEAGDHIIYLVTITAGHCHHIPDEFEPFVHLRKNGLSY
jgi:flavin reductase (DIM6/NTAB) family NADH-FMN oxidoreductase RutF